MRDWLFWTQVLSGLAALGFFWSFFTDDSTIEIVAWATLAVLTPINLFGMGYRRWQKWQHKKMSVGSEVEEPPLSEVAQRNGSAESL